MTSPANATRSACVFCGATGRKMSKEHLWPDWMRSQLPSSFLDRRATYTYEDSNRGTYREIRDQPLFDMRVKSVCEPCNNNWMNRIETDVQRYIEGMLQGKRRMLHGGGQTAIARWGTLKALVAQRAFRGHQQLPASDYQIFHRTRDEQDLDSRFTVYTARSAWSQGAAVPGFFRANFLRDVRSKDFSRNDGYLLTFSALDLVIQVMRLFGEDEVAFGHSPRLVESVTRIWPPCGSFPWPPGPALTTAGLKALSGSASTEKGHM